MTILGNLPTATEPPSLLSPLAIAALISAILGTVAFFVLDMRALLLSLLSIVLGVVALRRINARRERGRWAALAAIIIGAITPTATLLLVFGLFAISLANG